MEGAQKVLLSVLMVAVVAEMLWAKLNNRHVYNLKETLGNFSMLAVNNGLKSVSVAWSLAILTLLEPLQVYRLPDTAWAFVVTFVIVDFAYYWYHRMSHEVPILWTMHHTHHSSPWMNLTTAVRLNWIAKFLTPLFFAPLVLLGLSPVLIGASLVINLSLQFFLHTEAIGRLGWFEGKLFNTPSAHRVHHGSNPQYIDRNYAGVFIIWDRLFGTYEPEGDPVNYGVTSGFIGHNPFVAQFQPLWQYMRGEWRREKEISNDPAAPPRQEVPDDRLQTATAHES